ncbi:MAG: DNA mismatch repair endonuclease MutL [Prevotella sp.]|nr:DNA mismatch repair endonuclease MutL [Prevotella sp.]
MSDVIQLLPDSVANQIAAGEVIQRPASVIKELVENAVDAGARTIQVIVVDAGRTSLQVIDDGKGMSETDARLAFERHATSKIRKADDLFALTTMGFRGEALPSIAAVSQVELRTRMEEQELGTRIRLSGSKVEEQELVSCPKGSNFKVENLFFNVPARRKFLKTNATELNNILTAFERIVLVYPEIAFSLYSNGQELMNLKNGTLRQRISDVFGKRFNQDLLEVSVETAICKISGFVGKPESARKKGAHDYFFVNGRFMKHAYFHKAVMQAFDRLVPVGMQVPYFIYFEVAPSDIDVNIHPTKTEIKFENEQAVWQILMAAVKDAIGKFCEIPQIDFDTEGRPDIPVFSPEQQVAPPQPSYNSTYNPFKQHSERSTKSANGWEQLYDQLARRRPTETEVFDTTVDETPASEVEPLIEEKSPVHYQYKGRYIMTAVKSGLMIIDQYRADVRIRYERYLSQLEAQAVNSQRMLFPEVVRFSPSDAVVLEKILPELQGMGFELSDLGQYSYAIQAIPAGLEGLNYVQLVHDMVSDAIEKGAGNLHDIHSSLALSLARHAAIPQGQILSNEEMESIVNELFACSNVNYTPDGKAILCILPQKEIEQLLG